MNQLNENKNFIFKPSAPFKYPKEDRHRLYFSGFGRTRVGSSPKLSSPKLKVPARPIFREAN